MNFARQFEDTYSIVNCLHFQSQVFNFTRVPILQKKRLFNNTLNKWWYSFGVVRGLI